MSARLIIIAGIALGLAGSVALGKPDIPPAQARANAISSAEQVLAPKKYKYDISKPDIVNPFAPHLPAAQKAEVRSLRPASDHDLLVILANQLNPTGVLMLGNDALLMFGEKKVKVGESILIPFDNQTYEVGLVDLSRTAFTVRYNTEQITRPIKPAKAP